MLKHHRDDFDLDIRGAAASARLCVETETIRERAEQYQRQPPPRGCVLKLLRARTHSPVAVAAASARLCVETEEDTTATPMYVAAASARLCVETTKVNWTETSSVRSRLRAAVC